MFILHYFKFSMHLHAKHGFLYRNNVLGIDPEGFTTFGDMGGFQTGILTSLSVGWVITCLCVLFGIKSTGKVVYFTATFPYLIMIILMIAGLQLEGAYQV